ncbi:MAG: cohesin domain-containing protein, partial [Gallionella sp.]
TLTACAQYRLNRDGMSLMEKGEYEAGLKKLSAASAAKPGDAAYRADYLSSLDKTLNRLIANANSEKAAGRHDNAQLVFGQVLTLDPVNSRAILGLEELLMGKRHAAALESTEELLKSGDLVAAQDALKPVLLENPKDGKAILLQRQIEGRIARQQATAIALQTKFKKPVNLQFRDASLKLVFEALSRTSGINILLDRDVKSDLKTSVFSNDVSVEDTIDIILLQNQLEKKILNENSVFIYPNTPSKLKEYQELKIRSFHFVNADAKQMLTMIKSLLKTKDMFVHEKTNSLIMRDTPEAIRLAEKIVADQDGSDPEVMLEVEVLEVSRTKLSELGISLPDHLSVSTPTNLTLRGLRQINEGSLAVNSLNATLNLKLQDGDVNVLASPRIRVRSGEKAKFLIGDRVPVISKSTQLAGGTSASSSSVNYVDVGLKLEVEPDVHADREVGIKINLDVSSIVREILVEGTLAYQIGTRSASTVLRLKDGETQVLAGLINDEDRQSSSKVPGLGQLPVLGRLFSSQKDDTEKTEIILSITPRIVGNVRLPDAGEIEFWTGTESSLRSTPISLKTIGDESVIDAGKSARQPAQFQSPPAPPQPQPQPNQLVPAVTPDASAAVVEGIPNLVMSWLGPAQAKVGSKINLTLNGKADQGVSGLSLLVSFDPAALRLNGVLEGSFWKKTGASQTFTKSIDPESGQVMIDVTQPIGQEGAKGTGGIMTLNFDVIGANPQTQIAVKSITPANASGNVNPIAVPEPHNMLLKP